MDDTILLKEKSASSTRRFEKSEILNVFSISASQMSELKNQIFRPYQYAFVILKSKLGQCPE